MYKLVNAYVKAVTICKIFGSKQTARFKNLLTLLESLLVCQEHSLRATVQSKSALTNQAICIPKLMLRSSRQGNSSTLAMARSSNGDSRQTGARDDSREEGSNVSRATRLTVEGQPARRFLLYTMTLALFPVVPWPEATSRV